MTPVTCTLSWLGPCDRSPSGYHWCKRLYHVDRDHECRCGSTHVFLPRSSSDPQIRAMVAERVKRMRG
jgi:hypothetical protein